MLRGCTIRVPTQLMSSRLKPKINKDQWSKIKKGLKPMKLIKTMIHNFRCSNKAISQSHCHLWKELTVQGLRSSNNRFLGSRTCYIFQSSEQLTRTYIKEKFIMPQGQLIKGFCKGNKIWILTQILITREKLSSKKWVW